MTRPFVLLIGLAALAVAGSAAFLSCSDEKPRAVQSGAQSGQRRERVSIATTPIRESPDQDMRNSRASLMRILADERDAVTAPFPGTLTVDLPASGAKSFASALALVGHPPGQSPLRVRMLFELDFIGPARIEKGAITLGYTESVTAWCPILVPRGTDEPVKLVIRGKWIGEEPPKNPPPVRMCLALPDASVLGNPTADPKAAAQPNVLVISVDTLRADHLGCYGYPRATSPHIDALVARGALFERACSPAPWTLPSYGSLFTGLLPADHRAGIVSEREAAFGRDEEPAQRTTELLCPDVPTLAELLAGRGYQTAGFVCNPYLGAGAGLARGFQAYTSYQYTSQNGVDLALEWITSRPASRWFVFLHVIDPHMPYAPPRPYDTRFSKTAIDDLPSWPPDLNQMRAQAPDQGTQDLCVDYYDGEIAFVDDQIGRMVTELEKAGALENTLIVFHSDHGEEFWEHGSCDHGHAQYEELLHVPFALVWPGKIAANQRIATRVRTLDLLPTLGEYAGFAAPAGLEGKSLVPVLNGTESADRECISEAILHSKRESKAVSIGRDKLIATGASANALHDLSSDPRELRDRSASAPDVVQRLRARLQAHHDRATASACKAAPLQLDEATRRRLHGFGYGGAVDDAVGPPKPTKKP